MSKFISLQTPVQKLDYTKAWELLTEKERNYAYFLERASWAGAKMVFHQISYESPALFLIFQAYYQERDFLLLEEAALKSGVSQDHYKMFVAYSSGFYGNMSNYHNFGDMKFIPEISSEVFLQILKSNPLYEDEDAFYKEAIDELYPQVETELFAVDKPYTQLGYPEDGGVTGYFGRNMTKEDLAKVTKFAVS